MSVLQKIVKWNDDRGLIVRGFNLTNELNMVQEELIEASTPLKSKEARKLAKMLTKQFISEDFHPEDAQVIDALGDIVVYAIGAMAKLEYDPDIVMDEVLKEITSRTGEVIDGKFVKDDSEEAENKWYFADFSQAKLK